MDSIEQKNKKRKLVQDNVTDHYNALPYHTRESFAKSPIATLKKLNSWTKAMLINQHCKTGDNVLELCSGKGGDAAKYDNRTLMARKVVWMDVAKASVEEAADRIRKDARGYEAEFIVGDCFQVDIHVPELLKDQLFDMVSCQMAFHYCFENQTKARAMLHNVSLSLKEGGYFIGTLPSYDILRKKINATFENDVVAITYDNFPAFGARYKFKLKDAINNCPEYLVHMGTLKNLAAEFKLELIYTEPFHKYHAKISQTAEGKNLWQRMKLPEHIDPSQWEAYGLYAVMVFRRMPGDVSNKNVRFVPTAIEVDKEKNIKHCKFIN